ncbi:c-type cytochrome [Allonocardiopsis opalescens]
MGYAVVFFALVAIGTLWAVLAPNADRAEARTQEAGATQQDLAAGQALFEQSCSSCHGIDGQGRNGMPSLQGVGAAAVDFQVSTGRMPSMNPDVQMPRKPPVFTEEQIDQLAAYVSTSFGGGPEIPASVDPDEDYARGDIELGQRVFMSNCAQCHNFVGQGGALTGGRFAPELTESTPEQIYEALISGPGAMPVFDDETLTPEEKLGIINYIVTVRAEPDSGGLFNLGRLGPSSEGLVAWTVGIGLIVAAAMWITARQREND